MKDFIARLTSYKTTIMGVITALLTVLAAVGVADQDDVSGGIVATNELYDAVLVVLGSISTIALIFSKDSEVVEREMIDGDPEEGVE